MSGDSCGDFTSVRITNFATDDRDPADGIGYRVTLVAGALPSGLSLPGEAVHLALPDGSLWLMWPGIESDVDFTLQFVAIDAAGNESGPQTVRIHDDVGGCNVGRRHGSGLEVLALAVLAAAMTARPRRRGQRGR